MWIIKKTTLTDANSKDATLISDLSGHSEGKGRDYVEGKQESEVKLDTTRQLLYDDKEKIQPIVSQLQTNPADVTKIKLDLDGVAKIIKDFEI